MTARTALAPHVALLRTTTPAPWDGVLREPPLLAIEVVSESRTLATLALTAQVYRQAGVEEVWVVDHHTHVVEVAKGRTPLDEAQTLTSELLPGFSVSVRSLLQR